MPSIPLECLPVPARSRQPPSLCTADTRKMARFAGSNEETMHTQLQTEKSQHQASTSNSEYQAFMLKRQVYGSAHADV